MSTPPDKVDLDTALACQARLESALAGVCGIRGIGLGFDRARQMPELKVLVDASAQIEALPDHVDALHVSYDLVDDIKAL